MRTQHKILEGKRESKDIFFGGGGGTEKYMLSTQKQKLTIFHFFFCNHLSWSNFNRSEDFELFLEKMGDI